MFNGVYSLEHAYNGLEGFNKISSFSPEVIITDIKMPKEGGLDFLKKSMKAYPDIPVVIMTAHADKNIILDSLNSGAYYLIEKPFQEAQIKKVQHKALKKRLENHFNQARKELLSSLKKYKRSS